MKQLFRLALCSFVIVISLSRYSFGAQDLIKHIQESIAKAEAGESKLTPEVLRIHGYTSPKIKHFLNNLCALPGSNYLEVGVYQGATFVAACYGNQDALSQPAAIDNWSEFGNNNAAFMANTAAFLPKDSFVFYSQDAFSIDLGKFFHKPITIYFYDGNHSFEAQRRAFTYYNPVLADTFIAIVDDWNWHQVQNGTRQAFAELNYTILFEIALPAYSVGDTQNWWNGFYIAVIQKPTAQ